MRILRLPFPNPIRIMPDIGSRIRQAREECGLTQGELAQAIGFHSATAVTLIENNKRNLSVSRLFLISEVTGLPPGFFFSIKKEEE